MSSFKCETCGVDNIDKPQVGYVSGCWHNPPKHSDFVTVFFGGDTTPARAFYEGAWYKSERAKSEGRAVHPVAWDSIKCVHGAVETECDRCERAWQARHGGA